MLVVSSQPVPTPAPRWPGHIRDVASSTIWPGHILYPNLKILLLVRIWPGHIRESALRHLAVGRCPRSAFGELQIWVRNLELSAPNACTASPPSHSALKYFTVCLVRLTLLRLLDAYPSGRICRHVLAARVSSTAPVQSCQSDDIAL